MPCNTIRDASGRVTAIVCSRGQRRRTCVHCGRPSSKLCDFQVAPGKTCDAALCSSCSTSGGHDVDYCKEHAEAGAGVQPALPSIDKTPKVAPPARLAVGTKLAHPCPACRSAMVLRSGRFGLFYGCKGYPICRRTVPAGPDGRPFGAPARGDAA